MNSPSEETEVATEHEGGKSPRRALPMEELLKAQRKPVRSIRPDYDYDGQHYDWCLEQLPDTPGVVLLFRDDELLYVAQAESISSFVANAIAMHYTEFHFDGRGAVRPRKAITEYIGVTSFGTRASRRRAQLRVDRWLEDCELAWIQCRPESAELTIESLAEILPPVNRIVARLELENDEPPQVVVLGHAMTQRQAIDRLLEFGFVAATVWFAIFNYARVLTGVNSGWEPGVGAFLAHLVIGAIFVFFLFGIVFGMLGNLWTTFRQHAIAIGITVFLFPPALLLTLRLFYVQ